MSFTPLEDIKNICEFLSLDFTQITNVYNYGSQTLGNETPSSDYDIVIVGKFVQEPLKFKLSEHPYFYDFEMKKFETGGRLYDVIWHSNENFEKLLEVNFLMFVEALFNETKYHQINKIDYKKIYIEKYYSVINLKTALTHEHGYSYGVYKKLKQNKLNYGLDGKWVIKKLYNSLRYHTTVSGFIVNVCDNKLFEFKTFGKELKDFKQSILLRYENEGEDCINEIASHIFQEIKRHLEIINDIYYKMI